jgi:hypothetical protein
MDLTIGCEGGWNGKFVGECWKNWMRKKDLKGYREFPLVAS